ncbi:MAG: hypothetical protein DRR16_14605 [Candidatus Parabeggiatoa sp. nov. 3]|nr:MAG: hypothetical protein DRR00_01205 [Gammaproteobacteria bacterium]RKZ62484.1 MAG: hypothetical protein DRQ99_18625 [Gammaproteobacteria bacterium]RKZ84484.1 MAG: hypothetical protein DRR16_14605 [Gammaproteobacteria bacterium]
MFSRIYKYNHELNSYDLIKFIAIIAMIIDHIGFFFIIENTDYWRAIGRLAAPLFFFIVGYVSKYHIRFNILFYGILITLVHIDLGYPFLLNILIVIVCIKWLLDRWQPSQANTLTLVLIFISLYFLYFWTREWIEYGLLGFAYAICGHLVATQTKPIFTSFCIAATLFTQFFERILFNDNLHIAFIISSVAILLYLIMALFRYQVFTVHNPIIKNTVLIFSRYSLEIYFWHLFIFTLIFLLFFN